MLVDPLSIASSSMVMNKGLREALKGREAEENSVRVNPKVMEQWVNDTLLDAETIGISFSLLKAEKKSPLMRYGIARPF